MTLLERVAKYLSDHAIPHALDGASALAVHGVSRSTLDQDLLIRDRRALDPQFWSALHSEATIDVRHGDTEDPLAWQDPILERATMIADGPLRVVEAADLILLKVCRRGSGSLGQRAGAHARHRRCDRAGG